MAIESDRKRFSLQLESIFRGIHRLDDYDEQDRGKNAIFRFVATQLRRIGVGQFPIGAFRVSMENGFYTVAVPLTSPFQAVLKLGIVLHTSLRPVTHFDSKSVIQLARGQMPYETVASIAVRKLELDCAMPGAK